MTKAKQSTAFEDKRGNALPLMRPVKGSSYDFTFTATKGTTPEITEDCVRLRATQDCYVKIGEIADLSVSASDYDFCLLAGESVDIELFETDKYISAVQLTAGGTMYINGWR